MGVMMSPRQAQMITHGAQFRDTISCLALGAWRLSKGVYVVDPTFAAAVRTSVIHAVPYEILQRMPERCVYIATEWDTNNEILGRVLGFFAQLTLIDDEPRLLILLDTEYGVISAIVSPSADGTLSDEDTVEAGELEQTLATEWARLSGSPENPGLLGDVKQAETISARRALSLVLYLCSEEPDITGGPPQAPRTIHARKGPREYPPEEIQMWSVGVRLGAVFRKAQAPRDVEGSEGVAHGSPRPHLRRGHYHHYWRGPKAEPAQRQLILRWVYDVPVNTARGGELPITVRPVDDGEEQ